MMRHPDDAEHVARCPDCQARASLRGLDVDLEKVWAGVAAGVSPEVPSASPDPTPGSLAGRLVRSGLARVRVPVPSPVFPLILAIAAVSAIGAVATPTTGGPLISLVPQPSLASDPSSGSYARQQATAGWCSPSATSEHPGSKPSKKPAYTLEPPSYRDEYPRQSSRTGPPAPSYYRGWWPQPPSNAPDNWRCPGDGLREQAAASAGGSPGLLR